MTRPFRPGVELLEDRLTPSNTGVPWPDPGHLRLSFVPDGAAVGQQNHNNLFAKLNAVTSPSVWQNEIVRAFKTWQTQADINVRVVSDNGQPLGALGAPEGDADFGDIRVAAAPLPAGAVCTAQPFNWTGTTWAGDI